LPVLVPGTRLLLVELVVGRRRDWLVVGRQRAVHEASRHVEPAEAVRPHDERSGAGKRIHACRSGFGLVGGTFRRDVVRHVVTGPFFLLRIPPHPLFTLAPWFSFGIGGGTVVHNPPVRRPRPTPLQLSAGFARRVGRASVGEILARRRQD